MSCGPPVSGSRVNAIKSQFESLNNLECHQELNSSNSNTNNHKSPPFKYNFRRAATSIDLLKKQQNPSTDKLTHKIHTKWSARNDSVFNKTAPAATSSIEQSPRLDSSTNILKVKQSIDEREFKLSRQTSDSTKRTSIRRSPAFRVGDKQNNHTNHKSKVITSLPLPSKNDHQFENFLLNKCVTEFDKLKQSGLTDSLKFALRQPLPAGPPPKKPPRTFLLTNNSCSSSSSDDNNGGSGGGGDKSLNSDINSKQQNNELKSKINYLENSLLFTTANHNKNTNILMKNAQSVSKLQKCKTEILQGTKFLDCLSCHKNSTTNVYDSANSSIMLDERKPLMQCNNNINLNKKLIIGKHFTNTVEPIYMEPFSHLKKDKTTSNGDMILEEETTNKTTNLCSSNNSNTTTDTTFNETICSCPENHTSQNDLHYLCTAINSDNNIEDSDDNSLSLNKTYDEITILVDAAFQQQQPNTKENHKLYNRSYSNNDVMIGNDSTTSSSSSSVAAAVRLSRTLTEKRKDYVRRVAILPENHTIHQKYGTIHHNNNTFKSPVIKTFSLENKLILDNDNDNKDDVKLTEKHGENSMNEINQNKMIDTKTETDNQNNNEIQFTVRSLNDRIDNYQKLIEENSTSMTNFTHHHKSNQKSHQHKKCSANQSTNINEKILIENEKLFQVCLLIGYNTSTKSAYLKSKYPPNESIPDNIEQLVFPSNELVRSGREYQQYCLILTDNNAFKIYGYCRRVLPEAFDMCLPLCYCILTVTNAFGFYQKILKEIECRHGQSELQWNLLLKNLQNTKLPDANEYLHIKWPISTIPPPSSSTKTITNTKISPKRLSLEINPKWLTESAVAASNGLETILDDQQILTFRKSSIGGSTSGQKSLVQEFEEKKLQQQQQTSGSSFDLSATPASASCNTYVVRDPKYDEIKIRRPSDLRLENTELSDLLLALGDELLVNVFATLLHERKIIFYSKNITLLSKSILALQSILYPFIWQYIIVTILPQNLLEICQAPFPVLAGVLDEITFDIEDGIIIDIDHKKILQNCGDEHTILPKTLRKSLQLSLQMVELVEYDQTLSGVLISEAFLRFFVELFGNYHQKYFNKTEFIQCHQLHEIKYFLEWFLETSMFHHYCINRYQNNNNHENSIFYDLFDARLIEKSENTAKMKNIETIVKNSKIINHKKGKSFGKRLKEFLNHN